MTGLLGDCPVPVGQYERIVLGHGSGGRLTADLVHRVFLPAFGNDVLSALEDQATLRIDGARLQRLARGVAHDAGDNGLRRHREREFFPAVAPAGEDAGLARVEAGPAPTP